MNLGLVLRRSRREWRQLGILTVALCLVTAFFALGPLYARASIQSGLQYQIQRINDANLNLTLISQKPYKPADWNFISQQLGPLNAGLTRITRSGAAFGGFQYLYGEVIFELSPRSIIGYHVYAFSNMHSILKLVDGRWPERLAPPDSPERNASSEEERIAKGIGIYSQGDVEAVITREVAKATQYEIGTRFVIGERPENHVIVKVVGIVQAVDPNDPLWNGNNTALTGETVSTGRFTKAYNMGFFVTEGAYTDWVAPATRLRTGDNNSYIWQIKLNASVVNADNITDYREAMTYVSARLSADYAGLFVLNPLLKLLNNYNNVVRNIQGPIILLSGAVLILMLYHLVTTVNLVLEQQLAEWASMSSRGANVRQLVALQGVTMLILGGIGFAVGPFLAYVILQGLTLVGPLAAATGGIIPIAGIPATAFQLSAIAAALAVLMLTLPAIPAARRSLAQFKQMSARPPSRPIWARFGLDLVLILVGIGFMARLLFFVEGDFSQTLGLLTSDPGRLIQLIIDSANRSGGLNDPLNLLGPALLLTGVALLWLRLFPLLMRLIGSILGRSNSLTAPLSVWNVERDPGHYAQLVLLLIGTLALGTAALALGSTRDQGAWTASRLATGGSIRVTFDPQKGQSDKVAWTNLPGVTGTAYLTSFQNQPRPGENDIYLVGIDPATLIKTFPETAATASVLTNQPTDQRPPVPVVISAWMAQEEGRALNKTRLPLQVGQTEVAELSLPIGKLSFKYQIVGITRFFPSLDQKQYFLIMDARTVTRLVNNAVPTGAQLNGPTQVWLETTDRQPSTALQDAIQKTPGVTDVTYAWDQYNVLLREPLPAALAGMLYAGFWVSLLLSLLDFAFYLVVTARRRSLGFAVLQALGWNINNIWALLIAEQAALIIPALLVGVALGVVLAYVILPFLALVGGETLRLPALNLIVLLLTLLIGFGILSFGAARWLRRLNVNQVLRLGEE